MSIVIRKWPTAGKERHASMSLPFGISCHGETSFLPIEPSPPKPFGDSGRSAVAPGSALAEKARICRQMTSKASSDAWMRWTGTSLITCCESSE